MDENKLFERDLQKLLGYEISTECCLALSVAVFFGTARTPLEVAIGIALLMIGVFSCVKSFTFPWN